MSWPGGGQTNVQGVCCTAETGDVVSRGRGKRIRSIFREEYRQHSRGVRGVSAQQKAVSTHEPPACAVNSCILNQARTSLPKVIQSHERWPIQLLPVQQSKENAAFVSIKTLGTCFFSTDKANQQGIHHRGYAESSYCTKEAGYVSPFPSECGK